MTRNPITPDMPDDHVLASKLTKRQAACLLLHAHGLPHAQPNVNTLLKHLENNSGLTEGKFQEWEQRYGYRQYEK